MKRLVLVLAACGGAAPPPPVAPAPAPPSAPVAPVADVRREVGGESPSVVEQIVEPTGAPGDEVLAGMALVWIDAPLYTAPHADAPTRTLAKLENRRLHLGEAMPMRVISTKGDFVEVEMPAQDALRNVVSDCAWFGVATQFDVEGWRVFVRRADLAPVLAKHLRTTFSDGSDIEARPGAPALPLADGRVLVELGGMWIPLAAPLAHSYAPLPARGEAPALKHRLQATYVDVANERVLLRSMWAPLAARVEMRGDTAAFPIVDSCGTATVITPAASVEPYVRASSDTGGIFGVGFGTGEVVGAERWYLPKGTPLVVEGGTARAVASTDITIPKPGAAKSVCVERAPLVTTSAVFGPKLESLAAQPLRICARARAVKYQKAARFGAGRGGFGTGKR